MHVVEVGDGEPLLFVHGWPESWCEWESVMACAAGDGYRAMAIDLPGIGLSEDPAADGSKAHIASRVHEVICALQIRDPTLVGHDAGGMAVFSYVRTYDDVSRCVIFDTVIPGLDPWDDVLRNPYIWHFAFHSLPHLPELLVGGHQREYFDYFYDILAARPDAITEDRRARHAIAYTDARSLRAGFDLYRTLNADALVNRRVSPEMRAALLYVRGTDDPGDVEDYRAGFQRVGIRDVATAVVPGAGHFAPEESPRETWQVIHEFLARHRTVTAAPLPDHA